MWVLAGQFYITATAADLKNNGDDLVTRISQMKILSLTSAVILAKQTLAILQKIFKMISIWTTITLANNSNSSKALTSVRQRIRTSMITQMWSQKVSGGTQRKRGSVDVTLFLTQLQLLAPMLHSPLQVSFYSELASSQPCLLQGHYVKSL